MFFNYRHCERSEAIQAAVFLDRRGRQRPRDDEENQGNTKALSSRKIGRAQALLGLRVLYPGL